MATFKSINKHRLNEPVKMNWKLCEPIYIYRKFPFLGWGVVHKLVLQTEPILACRVLMQLFLRVPNAGMGNFSAVAVLAGNSSLHSRVSGCEGFSPIQRGEPSSFYQIL
jgi:hypothetical protein